MNHLLKTKIIDLTLPYSSDIRGFESQVVRSITEDGWNARMLNIYSHAGTHMDAPVHFGLEGTIDEFAPQCFMGYAWILRLRNVQPGEKILVDHLDSLIHKIEKGDSLLIHTGWSKYLTDSKMYRDQLPRISKELARWLVEKEIKMLGVEPPSVANVNDLEEVTTIHQILFKGNIVIVEGLTNLNKIQQDRIWLMAFPLKIQNGDGAPTRVFAFET